MLDANFQTTRCIPMRKIFHFSKFFILHSASKWCRLYLKIRGGGSHRTTKAEKARKGKNTMRKQTTTSRERRNFIKATLYKLHKAAQNETKARGLDPKSPKGYLVMWSIYKTLQNQTRENRVKLANRAGL